MATLSAALALSCTGADNRANEPSEASNDTPAAFDSTTLPRVAIGERVLRYEVDSLPALIAQFSGNTWRAQGDESGDTRLCYVGTSAGHPASVVFGASSLGGPSLPIAFVELSRDVRESERGSPCPTLAPPVTLWAQDRELALDTSIDSLIALLGAPASRVADTLTFTWSRSTLGPYRTIGTQRDTIVEWSLYTHLVAIVSNNRVRELRLSHSTTY